MKKLFILGILAFGFTQTTTAQKKGDVEFGLNIGYNSSNVSNDDSTSDIGRGINFGFSTDYYFSDRWSIKAKLIYDQKGWNNDYITDINSGVHYRTNYDLNYLTIPVMANWHFAPKRNWYLNFGLYTGFLLNAKDTEYKNDVTDYFEKTDFGLAVGVGVKIPVSNKLKLSLEYDFQGGMMDINKGNEGLVVTNSRSSFNIGINFLLK